MVSKVGDESKLNNGMERIERLKISTFRSYPGRMRNDERRGDVENKFDNVSDIGILLKIRIRREVKSIFRRGEGFLFLSLSHRPLKDNPMLRIIISWPCVIPMTKCCYVLSTGSDPMEFK